MSSPYAESGIAAASASGIGWPGPPFPAPVSNGPELVAPVTPVAASPADGTLAPAPVLTVTLPPGAVQVMAVDPSRQFVMVRTDPRMTSAQFEQYVADVRGKVPPELWPRIVILPAAQFTVLG